uniref:Retrotransposon protein n=1 Tax=Solanum tuberosum TaxID=4113 RepID=M1BR37_SOLTU
MLGLDYAVQYKKRTKNRVVDALSRQFENGDTPGSNQPIERQLLALSVVEPKWMLEISSSYEGDAHVEAMIAEVTTDQMRPHLYQYSSGVLKKKGKLFIGGTGELRHQLISIFHDSPVGGHPGQLGTFRKLAHVFYWPGMRQMVNTYVAACEVCQRNKGEHVHYPGLLQPLPIPDQA